MKTENTQIVSIKNKVSISLHVVLVIVWCASSTAAYLYQFNHLLQEIRDTFYSRNIGYYNVVQWVNKNLSPSDRILNPVRYLNYLFEVPYFYLKSSSQILIENHSLANTEKIYNQLITQRITHIINSDGMADILVDRGLFYDLIKFNTVVYYSRTLGDSKKVSCRIIKKNK